VLYAFGLKGLTVTLISGPLVCPGGTTPHPRQAGMQTRAQRSEVAVVDFNGNGRPDLVVAIQGTIGVLSSGLCSLPRPLSWSWKLRYASLESLLHALKPTFLEQQ
jgi:FG-GAP repeat